MSTPTDPHTPKLSIMLTATDVVASVAFYKDMLGFTLDESWPNDQAPMWASMSLNGQVIMIGCMATPESDCGGPEGTFYLENTAAFQKEPGGGMMIYVQVDDVDAYHADITARGAAPVAAPRDEFYGLRDFPILDADGYRLYFFQPITMTTCQSCGMPLTDAKVGQMYCGYCTTPDGHLKSFEEVLEGTIQGYFMGMQKMEREPAEAAAKELLRKMPAWAGEHWAE